MIDTLTLLIWSQGWLWLNKKYNSKNNQDQKPKSCFIMKEANWKLWKLPILLLKMKKFLDFKEKWINSSLVIPVSIHVRRSRIRFWRMLSYWIQLWGFWFMLKEDESWSKGTYLCLNWLPWVGFFVFNDKTTQTWQKFDCHLKP